jgi:hypothetical protein
MTQTVDRDSPEFLIKDFVGHAPTQLLYDKIRNRQYLRLYLTMIRADFSGYQP